VFDFPFQPPTRWFLKDKMPPGNYYTNFAYSCGLFLLTNQMPVVMIPPLIKEATVITLFKSSAAGWHANCLRRRTNTPGIATPNAKCSQTTLTGDTSRRCYLIAIKRPPCSHGEKGLPMGGFEGQLEGYMSYKESLLF
jgi:hypothetical protein